MHRLKYPDPYFACRDSVMESHAFEIMEDFNLRVRELYSEFLATKLIRSRVVVSLNSNSAIRVKQTGFPGTASPGLNGEGFERGFLICIESVLA
jgi:hypothetical protein